ncbi:MAG: DUF58 domain-containing protein [Bradymonadia bacterium]
MIEQASHEAASSKIDWLRRGLFIGLHLSVALAVTFGVQLKYGVYYVLSIGTLAAIRRLAKPRRRRRASRLKFTREGKYIVGITIGVGLAAVNTGNNLLYLFLGMLLSLIIISGVLSELTLSRLRIRRHLPEHIFARHPVLVTLELTNLKKRLPSFSVQVDDRLGLAAKAKRCFFLKVSPGKTQATSYRTEFARRGLYSSQPLVTRTRFPFSFFIKERKKDPSDDQAFVVYPAVHPRLIPAAFAPTRAGNFEQQTSGQGDEFFGLDEYRDGQNSRNIDWKRSAATDKLIVKEFTTEAGQPQRFFLNDLYQGELNAHRINLIDELADIACSAVMSAVRAQRPVVIACRQATWQVDGTGAGLEACLRGLALLEFLSANELESTEQFFEASEFSYVISSYDTTHFVNTASHAKILSP